MRKITLKKPRFFKGLSAPYRMVFINDESLEEVASFHLTKSSVYTLFSTLFVLTIAATVAILLFTPLKYYIPGYGSSKPRVELLQLQQKVDSLSDVMKAEQQQAANIKHLIAGDDVKKQDTAMLSKDEIEAAPQSILPQPEEIKQQAAQQQVKKPRHRR